MSVVPFALYDGIMSRWQGELTGERNLEESLNCIIDPH